MAPPWTPDTYRVDEEPTRLQERAFAVQALRFGGTEIRPTRLFVWLGERGSGKEWILPLGSKPRLLRAPRRRRHVELAGCQISYLGNPALTVVLCTYQAVRRMVRRPRGAS
jgi:hypothetical protein